MYQWCNGFGPVGTSLFWTSYLGSISSLWVFWPGDLDVVNFRALAPACRFWVVDEEIGLGQTKKEETRRRRKADLNKKRLRRKNCDPFMAPDRQDRCFNLGGGGELKKGLQWTSCSAERSEDFMSPLACTAVLLPSLSPPPLSAGTLIFGKTFDTFLYWLFGSMWVMHAYNNLNWESPRTVWLWPNTLQYLFFQFGLKLKTTTPFIS